MGGWVWTTFYPFQWDLNYSNPAVFLEMLEVLLFLSNEGVEGFRLDSAPFLWKREGTHCRNQPEAYAIVEAWRAALSLVAPGVVLLAEAIESLDDVLPFFGSDAPGCHLAYNNGMMTALWGAIAEGDAEIARTVMQAATQRPDHAAWLNYVRCHDDLIWNALSSYAPRSDLDRWSRFFGGEGFSGGKAFQTAAGGVPSTNGMASALVGLGRQGIDPELAMDRLKLMYGIIHALDGWPLIYMGDEIALGNDETYAEDPHRQGDGRWLHRPEMDWQSADRRHQAGTPQATAFAALAAFIRAARSLNTLGVSGRALPVDAGPREILAFDRNTGSRQMRVLANMSAGSVHLDLKAFSGAYDLLSGARQRDGIVLPAYGLVWLIREA
jgi:amylosucrase